jgi:4-hydroxy-tetrahydrodipicolinate synthase
MFGGSMVALVTPMNGDGSLDLEALQRLVDFHAGAGTEALVIAGTTGESPCLGPAELERLVRAAVEAAAGRVPVIGGSGTNCTSKSMELTRVVREAGAAAALVVTPYYSKPTQEGLFRHYLALARTAGLPIVLYNVPSRTACDLLPETVARLAAVPGIAALKEAVPGTERVTRLRQLIGDALELYSGDDATAMEFIVAGGDGVISVTANVAPHMMRGMCDAARQGEPLKARTLNDRLEALHKALFLEPNPIPVKWAVMSMGLISAGIRLPLTTLNARHHEPLRQAMMRAGVESLS